MRSLSKAAAALAAAGLTVGLVSVVMPVEARPITVPHAAPATQNGLRRWPADARVETASSFVVKLRKGASRTAAVDRLDRTPGIDVLDSDVIAKTDAVTVAVEPGDAPAAANALQADKDVVLVEPDHRVYASVVT